MNKTLSEILGSRDDLSNYLFHFTKGNNALNTLKKIYDDNSIIDIYNKNVICFTEAPVISLVNMFDIFTRYSNPYYAPFGVGIKKDYLYNLGCRPVYYGPKSDLDLIDESLHWKFEEYDPIKKDFSWLREWRLPEKKLILPKEETIFITENKDDLYYFCFNESNVTDIDMDGCIADGQFWAHFHGTISRTFKGVSLEELKRINGLTKAQFEQLINNQSYLDKIENYPLGSKIM